MGVKLSYSHSCIHKIVPYIDHAISSHKYCHDNLITGATEVPLLDKTDNSTLSIIIMLMRPQNKVT